MNSKEKILASLNHISQDKIPLDFGSTPVSGIHVRAVEKLRDYYGLPAEPIKVTEPYQMLGEIDGNLKQAMGLDADGFDPRNTLFGFPNEGWKPFKTFWGQEVLVPEKFNTSFDEKGDLLIYPEGDTDVPASGKMPMASFFFDSIIRQEPVDETALKVEDNLEEFEPAGEEDIAYWKRQLPAMKASKRAVVANFGGTGFGDIALVPAPFLKHPKGIRDISEWYMSTVMRSDFVHRIFEKQADIAIQNLETYFNLLGNYIDVLFVCGTDFGTQDSTFCAPQQFNELWLPYYKRINDWVHQNTNWKTFKHSCGAVEGFMPNFIEAGFDIINPVQINARGMDPQVLKDNYGERLTFWGGGVDTQKVLSFGSPEEVRKQILRNCEIFSKNGGFVFNTVHNVQANVPAENLAAMMETIHDINS